MSILTRDHFFIERKGVIWETELTSNELVFNSTSVTGGLSGQIFALIHIKEKAPCRNY